MAKPSGPANLAQRIAMARGTEIVLPPIAGEISDAADTMTPDQGAALLKRLKKEVPDLWQRAALGRQIISSLCINGHPEEAWKLVETGFGEARNEQLRGFFTFGSKNDPNALAKLSELTDPREHIVALEGFLSHRELTEFSGLDFKALGIDSPEERRLLTEELSTHLASLPVGIDPKRREQLALEVINTSASLVNSGILTPGELGRLLETDRSLTSFEDMEILGKLNPTPGAAFNDSLSSARSSLVKQMVQEDAPKAMNVLLTDESLKKSPDLLGGAIFEWMERDNESATQWYSANGSNLTNEQRDSVLSTFVKTALKYNEVDTAEKWINEITNPDIKKKLSSNIKKPQAK